MKVTLFFGFGHFLVVKMLFVLPEIWAHSWPRRSSRLEPNEAGPSLRGSSTNILYTGFVTGVLRTEATYHGNPYHFECIYSWGLTFCCHLTNFAAHFKIRDKLYTYDSTIGGVNFFRFQNELNRG